MKFYVTIVFLCFAQFAFAQTPADSQAVVKLLINYRPATVIITSGEISIPSNVNYVGRISYRDLNPGSYKIYVTGPLKPTELKDSILLKDGQELVLDIKIEGPCLYDHPVDYIPTCPEGHTDNIVPVIYSSGEKPGAGSINQTDEKIHYAGRPKTGCDARFYCKQHGVGF